MNHGASLLDAKNKMALRRTDDVELCREMRSAKPVVTARNVDNPIYINYTSRVVSFPITSSADAARFPSPSKYHFAVNTAPKSYLARREIRRSWKRTLDENTLSGSTPALGRCVSTSDRRTIKGVARAFTRLESCGPICFEAAKLGLRFTSVLFNRTQLPSIVRHSTELKQHDDMVFIEFCDKYETLPLKNVQHHGAHRSDRPENRRMVVKIDDDVLPNFALFFDCFPTYNHKDFGIYGWVTIEQCRPRHVGQVPGRQKPLQRNGLSGIHARSELRGAS
ncbi:hypothetical protein BV898_16490 [Hypsibius exemplaris]|uniref:Hexosyltransferase n=1 Tax=Hypsibius exemplaris TaxID=2072580 RepID=A0A9X6NEW4_HYPEX|nr:hypothetical protein BV898_16490 [Hypsibius exemplaris]